MAERPATLKIRMSGELRAAIEEEARRNSCSLNAEIVRRLQQSFKMADIERARDKAEQRFDTLMNALAWFSRSGVMLEEAIARAERGESPPKERDE